MQYMVASHTSCRGPGCSIWWPLTQVVGVQDAVYGGLSHKLEGPRMQYMVASHTSCRGPGCSIWWPLTQVVGAQDAVYGGLSHKL